MVDLTLKIHPGPAGNADFDRALWGEPELVSGVAQKRAGPNVVLISLDTLRADFLGAYGYPRDTSPSIDSLAADGLVFENAMSQSAWTLPAHFAMLTGRFPDRQMLVYDESICRVGDSAVTLAETLRANGYLTAAFTGGGFVGYDSGFAQGFDFFRTYGRLISHSLPGVNEWLERFRRESFFLFLHSYDTHRPYAPPSQARDLFAGDKPEACAGIDFSKPAQDADEWEACVMSAEGIDHVKDLYAALLFDADRHLGQLFAKLSELGLMDDTIVVITSDHGEEFYEHGRTGHTLAVFQESIHVPLVFWGPGVPKGQREEETVALVDIVPTLLELLEIPAWQGLVGRSLVPRFNGSPLTSRPVYSASAWQEGWPVASDVQHIFTSAIQADGVKVIRNLGRNYDHVLRYSLRDDPTERHGLSPSQASVVERQLDRWLRKIRHPLMCTLSSPHSETRAQLEALGYLQ
ncbi:MAG: sulfatase [Acidobacteriota bacterium]